MREMDKPANNVPADFSFNDGERVFERLYDSRVQIINADENFWINDENLIMDDLDRIDHRVETECLEFGDFSRWGETVDYGYDMVNGSDLSIASISEISGRVLAGSSSRTVYVNGSNVGDPLEDGSLEHPFDKIQEGVDNASSGDTVYVFAGTYKEHLTVNKVLSLVGADRESVVVDGEGTGNCIYASANILVSKFTVRNGSHGIYLSNTYGLANKTTIRNINGSGVYVYDSSLFVDNALIEGCVGYGIDTSSHPSYGGHNFTLINSVILDNGGGVLWLFDSYPSDTYQAFVENNIIMDNGGDALRLSDERAKSAIIKNNVFMNNSGDGVYCYSYSTTMSNNTIVNAGGYGIYVTGSGSCTLLDNRVETSLYGIYLSSVSNATLVDNVMLNNRYNFGVRGSTLSHFTHNTDTSNTVNGKPIYYLVSIRNMIIDFSDAGYVGVVDSVNVIVQNLALANNVDGIMFAYVKNSGIRNVNVQNNRAGITLYRSTFDYIIGNNISTNEKGIYTSKSYLNFIYQNNFINNNKSAYIPSDAYINSWDNGANGGNYWSDHDCIGDPSGGSQPYFISIYESMNRDRYPFQHPINLETSKGNLRIRVTDSSGNPIAGALVTASYYQLVSCLDLHSITDSGGYVYFNDIISGTYTLYISANGYYPAIITGTVNVGQTSSEAITLTVNLQPYQSWALIVGVSYYQFINDLAFCDYDALALYNRLYPIWGKDHIKLLLNENATKQNINDAIVNWLAPMENQGNRVLVFFSGHGGNETYEYICPYDSYSGSLANDITDVLLNEWLNTLDSQKITVILDSCRSGGFIPELSKDGRIILTACDSTETSIERPDIQHAVFAHYLLTSFVTEGVDTNMDGKISWQEIFSYAEPRTTELNPEQHPQKYYGYSEEPVIIVPEFSQTLPLLFALLLITTFTIINRETKKKIARAN